MSVATPDTAPRRALVFTPMETDLDLLVDVAVRADRLGYDSISIPEGWGLDSTIVLSEIARRTERIRLVAGIVSIWGRTPATLAMTAATLDRLSGGRFVLGLGTSTPVLAERFHGVDFERPIDRLARTVDTIRSLLAGDRAPAVDGDAGLRLGVGSAVDVPIWVAGLGPRVSTLAIERADGWFPAMIPLSGIAERCAAAGDGADRCEMVTGPIAWASDDPALSSFVVQQTAAWYLTGMGTVYGDALAANGYADVVAALRDANPRPRPGSLVWPAEADVLLDELTARGSAADVARTLERWDAETDVVGVLVPPGMGDATHGLVEACAPSLVAT